MENKDKLQDEFMEFWEKNDNVGLGKYSDDVTHWWFSKIDSLLREQSHIDQGKAGIDENLKSMNNGMVFNPNNMNNTDKILAEFDEKFFTKETFDWKNPTPGEIKEFIVESIHQALAEERERVRGIIGSPEWLENHHCENNDGSSVCNCFKEAQNTFLSSLDKTDN